MNYERGKVGIHSVVLFTTVLLHKLFRTYGDVTDRAARVVVADNLMHVVRARRRRH